MREVQIFSEDELDLLVSADESLLFQEPVHFELRPWQHLLESDNCQPQFRLAHNGGNDIRVNSQHPGLKLAWIFHDLRLTRTAQWLKDVLSLFGL